VFKYGGWRCLKEWGAYKNKVSLWWNDLKEIWKSKCSRGSFEDRFKWEVGNERDILFLEDNWLSFGALKNICKQRGVFV